MNGEYYEEREKEERGLILGRGFGVGEIVSIIVDWESVGEKKGWRRVKVIEERRGVVMRGDCREKVRIEKFIEKWVKNIGLMKGKKDVGKEIEIDRIDVKVEGIFKEVERGGEREVGECVGDVGMEGRGVEKGEGVVWGERS